MRAILRDGPFFLGPDRLDDVNVHIQLGGERFVWDIDKARRNLEKHGLTFEVAAEVLIDPLVDLWTRALMMKLEKLRSA